MINKYSLNNITKLFHLNCFTLEFKSYNRIKLNSKYLKHMTKIIYNNNLKFMLNWCIKYRLLLTRFSSLYSLIRSIYKYTHQSYTLSIIIKLVNTMNYNLVIINNINNIIQSLFNTITKKTAPRRIRYIGILKSPHVFKKAQDHYEYRIYKTKIILPVLISYNDDNYITRLIEQTSKFDSNYQLLIERKNIRFLEKEIN